MIRPARADDAGAVTDLVRAAYEHYVSRIGREPAPMTADDGALIAAGSVSVLETANGAVGGVIVLVPAPDHLLVENVAVHPDLQGQGLGASLMLHAERRCAELGLPELRLYTHRLMTENRAWYQALGFEETGRGEQDGYARVFFRKPVG